MVDPRTVSLPAIGFCIYCGASGDELSAEHIVPLCLGGNVLLPRASCRACRDVTSAFERSVCRETYRALRAVHRYPSRRPDGMPNKLDVAFDYAGADRRVVRVPIDDAPVVVTLPRFPLPAFHAPVQAWPEKHLLEAVHLQGAEPDGPKWKRLFRIYGRGAARAVVSTGAIRITEYARLLYKVALCLVAHACPDVLGRCDLRAKVLSRDGHTLESLADLFSAPASAPVDGLFAARLFVATDGVRPALFSGVRLLVGIDRTEHFCRVAPAEGLDFVATFDRIGASGGAGQ